MGERKREREELEDLDEILHVVRRIDKRVEEALALLRQKPPPTYRPVGAISIVSQSRRISHDKSR